MEIDKYSKVSDFIQGDQISLGNQEYEFVESVISSCFRCALFNDSKKCLASSEIGNCIRGYFKISSSYGGNSIDDKKKIKSIQKFKNEFKWV